MIFADGFDHYTSDEVAEFFKEQLPPPRGNVLVFSTPHLHYIGRTPVTVIFDEDGRCQIVSEYLP